MAPGGAEGACANAESDSAAAASNAVRNLMREILLLVSSFD
jgi:hypothetical protein